MNMNMIMRAWPFLVLAASPAFAADPGKPARRGGMALAVELGGGGDSLMPLAGNEVHAGDHISALAGGFYRPRADSSFEVYGLAGYDFGIVVPVRGGGGDPANLTSPVVAVLANYRFDNKWFVAGGIEGHLNPRLTSEDAGFRDIHFHSATGVTVEAGWSFIGVYYRYMRYESPQANLDASSVGLRFTIRLRKWRPVN
jgi:hypothetical protein